MNAIRSAAAAVFVVLLGGCAGTLADKGFSDVATQAEAQLAKKPVWVRTEADALAVRERTAKLLARPLTADSAVEVALFNNRGLQAKFASLGIGAADLARAQLPDPPGFTYARLTRGDELEIERALSLGVLSLLTLPVRAAIEHRQFEQTKLVAVQDIFALAAQTRRAFFEAIAAQQLADYMDQADTAAGAGAELAKRMAEVGNWSLLAYLRQQAFSAETAMLRARTRLAAGGARERLIRHLGLFGRDLDFKLPATLPDLPAAPAPMEETERRALAERLDIRAARERVSGLASSFGLTQATRFFNVIEGTYVRNSETGRPLQTGYEVHIEVPIFDFGEANVVRAEAVYWEAINRLADTALNARSTVRETHATYRTMFDIATRYRDEILPMRRRISEDIVYRYNAMQVSVFDLLADSRDQINAVMAAIEAQRDFWIADTDLQFVILADTGSAATVVRAAPGGRAAGAGH